jgi:hypothetical protein
MVCVAATVLADPASSLGARNQRSREPGRLDTRSDSSPRVRGQLSPKQLTHTALGSVLRLAFQRLPARTAASATPHIAPVREAGDRQGAVGRRVHEPPLLRVRSRHGGTRAGLANAPLSPPWPPRPLLALSPPLATLQNRLRLSRCLRCVSVHSTPLCASCAPVTGKPSYHAIASRSSVRARCGPSVAFCWRRPQWASRQHPHAVKRIGIKASCRAATWRGLGARGGGGGRSPPRAPTAARPCHGCGCSGLGPRGPRA